MVGMSMARSTRSGTLVGPGICRTCRPECTVIGRPSRSCVVRPVGCASPLEYHYLAGLSPARRGPSMHKKQGFACQGGPWQARHCGVFQETRPMAAMKAEKLQISAENSGLAARLARETTGDVFFDAFNRG